MNPIQQALRQSGASFDLNSPISQASAQMVPNNIVSPIPPQDIISKAVSFLNPANSLRNLQQAQQPIPTPDIPSKIGSVFSENPHIARAVAMQESSLNPQARNTIPERGIDAIGLMQINLPAHLSEVPGNSYDEKAQNLMNPDINLQVARKIYDSQGWKPWEAFTSGDYKKYVK